MSNIQPEITEGPLSLNEEERDNQTQYESVESRHFNSLEFKSKSIIKYSPYHILDGEAYWYQFAPAAVKKYIPSLVSCKIQSGTKCFIEIERMKGPTLSHLYTNCCMCPNTLSEHFKTLETFHECEANEDFTIDIMQNYIPKIRSRCKESGDIFDSYCKGWETVRDKIIDFLEEYTASGIAKEVVIHGDPVFSNVIATLNDGLKLVDMRGKQGDVLTLRGDMMYDYAKTYQSICGYDFVLLDIPRCDTYVKTMRQLADDYLTERFGEEGLRYVRIITASLYFSLIPLHDDPVKLTKYFELCKEVLDLVPQV